MNCILPSRKTEGFKVLDSSRDCSRSEFGGKDRMGEENESNSEPGKEASQSHPEIMIGNLNLGHCSSCQSPSCCCHSRRRSTSSPNNNSSDFWRRTLRNPISKKEAKAKGGILTEPKLKLAFGGSRAPGHTPAITSNGPCSTNQCGDCTCRTMNGKAPCLLHPSVSSSATSTRTSDPEVSIPDLSNLSLGTAPSSSDLDKRLQKSLQINPNRIPHALQNPRRFRKLKWKNRIKCSLKDFSPPPSLPTIAEDDEALYDDEDENSETGLMKLTCSQQASNPAEPIDDISIDELASYLENGVYIPKKMSQMAELMFS